MKNNIIKDDREISLKAESLPTASSDDAESSATDRHLPPPDQLNMQTEMSTDTDNEPEVIGSNYDLPTEPAEMNNQTLADTSDLTTPVMMTSDPMIEPAAAGPSIQSEITVFVKNATTTATELFNNNRQLFTTLGWIVLAIVGTKIVFATLGIIDDIPLVTPLIKLVGLVTVVQFSWRYLLREQNRKELIEMIDRTKVEVLGDRKPLS